MCRQDSFSYGLHQDVNPHDYCCLPLIIPPFAERNDFKYRYYSIICPVCGCKLYYLSENLISNSAICVMILISHSRISINDCPNFGVRIRGGQNLCEGLLRKTARGFVCEKSKIKRVIREGGENDADKIK